MTMPGRKFSSGNYRYGFNGKEQDKETTGTSTYDYGFRIYNPALGRFLSVDPLSKSYPWNSPYAFAENDVIRSIDLDGLEKAVISMNDNTITFKITMAVFTNRPDKEINGVKYQGGNMPEGCTNAVEVAKNNYNLLNAALKNESYSLTINPTGRDKGELFGATDNSSTNQNFTVKFEVEILTFKDEDEMKKSDSYNNSVKDGSFAGIMLFGKSSYATVDGKEQAVSLDKNDGAKQLGTAKNKLKYNEKAYLIGDIINDKRSNVIPHEVGHGMGLNHDTEPKNSAGETGTKAANGSTYGTFGLMGLNKSGTPQAPTKAEVKQILDTIKGEIIPQK
jgi:RHS repeat-associated protein